MLSRNVVRPKSQIDRSQFLMFNKCMEQDLSKKYINVFLFWLGPAALEVHRLDSDTLTLIFVVMIILS